VENFLQKKSGVVIDLGAHQGFYTLRLKELCPKYKIIAIEADPSMFTCLKKTIEENKVKDVTLVNKAVAGTNDGSPFYVSMNAGVLGSKYLKTLKRDLRPWLKDSMIKKIEVPSITLKQLMKQYNLKVVDIVKMDVEDMEYEVLKASEDVLDNIKAIVVQWHSTTTRDQMIKLLKKHGFGISYYEPRDYGDIYFSNSRFIRL
jgi:FkbM family methyltransferase